MPGYNFQDGARPALPNFLISVLFSYLCIMRAVCVQMFDVLLPPGVNPTAVKYIYHITLPSSGNVSSAFWEMLNWGATDRILWMGVQCLVTWYAWARVTLNTDVLGGISYTCNVWLLGTWVHSAGKHNRRNHDTLAHRPHNHTLYDTPPIRSVFQVTQTDPKSSLMMADYCRNM
jgi:hypothetical protein